MTTDERAPVAAVRIDHVLVAVDDFAAATARLLDAHGLASVVGGRHTGLGTANWIVPLGSSYLELAGIVDPEAAAGNPFGRAVRRSLDAGGGPFAWCVVPDDFEATVARLRLDVNDGSRERPDGTVLRWRAAGFEASLADVSRPFFLEWRVPASLHPGTEDVPHRVTPHGITWVEVSGDESAVRSWLADPAVPVRVRPGPSAVLGVGIATEQGEIEIRGI